MLKLLLNKEAGLFLVSPETLPAISGVALPGRYLLELALLYDLYLPRHHHVRCGLFKEGTTTFGSQKGKDKRKQRLT